MIEVVNKQRRHKIDTNHWREFAGRALEVIGGATDAGVTIAFVSDRSIRELNRRFRETNRVTDVLSFPSDQNEVESAFSKVLGDIVVSVDRAKAQSEEHNLSFDEEIAELILHGLLHLKGYDHETDDGEMNRLEIRLRRRLGI